MSIEVAVVVVVVMTRATKSVVVHSCMVAGRSARFSRRVFVCVRVTEGGFLLHYPDFFCTKTLFY